MDIILVRHAKAEDRINWNQEDSLRPLEVKIHLVKEVQKNNASAVYFIDHEPDLGVPASYLLRGQEKPFILLKKGGIILIDNPNFNPTLLWHIHRKLITP